MSELVRRERGGGGHRKSGGERKTGHGKVEAERRE